MTAASTIQALPLWVWLSFTVVLVGVITLVYTQGNWRLTLAIVTLALLAALLANEIDRWDGYIHSHFIGHYDSLGVPFREAGPGWSLLWSGWPLWIIPTLIATIISLLAAFFINHFRAPTLTKIEETPEESLPLMQMAPTKNLAKQLEIETIKKELTETKEKLATAIKLAQQQLDENHELEIKLLHNEKEQRDHVADQEDKVTSLTLELEAKEAELENLRSIALEQADEIADAKAELKSHGLR